MTTFDALYTISPLSGKPEWTSIQLIDAESIELAIMHAEKRRQDYESTRRVKRIRLENRETHQVLYDRKFD